MTMTLARRPTYDTHTAIRRLTIAGWPEHQAEAIVQLYVRLNAHNLTIKTDVATIHDEIEKTRLGIKAAILEAKHSLIKWMIATNSALVALGIAVLKLL